MVKPLSSKINNSYDLCLQLDTAEASLKFKHYYPFDFESDEHHQHKICESEVILKTDKLFNIFKNSNTFIDYLKYLSTGQLVSPITVFEIKTQTLD